MARHYEYYLMNFRITDGQCKRAPEKRGLSQQSRTPNEIENRKAQEMIPKGVCFDHDYSAYSLKIGEHPASIGKISKKQQKCISEVSGRFQGTPWELSTFSFAVSVYERLSTQNYVFILR